MKKKLVIILGMHRSGTSMLSAGVMSLGFSLGNHSEFTSDENPKGFFENEEIVAFNEKLLAELGGRWDNPLFLGQQAVTRWDKEVFSAWLSEAAVLFEKIFAGADLLAVKDPRMCQLLPFWQRVFSQCGFDSSNTYYVMIVRDPREVSLSQEKRFLKNPDFYFLGDDLLTTAALWLSSNYQALLATVGDKLKVVLHDDLLGSPHSTLEAIADFLSVRCPEEVFRSFGGGFVDRSLKRNVTNETVDELFQHHLPEALAAFQKFAELSRAEESSRDTLNSLLDLGEEFVRRTRLLEIAEPQFSRALSDRHRCLVERRNAYEDLRQAYGDRDRAVQERDRVSRELGAIKASYSWKVTAPLRFFLGVLRYDRRQLFSYVFVVFRRMGLVREQLRHNHPVFSRRVVDPFVPAVKSVERLLIKLLRARVERNFHCQRVGSDSLSCYQTPVPNITAQYSPRVTVIVPNYNHAEYLEKRLESIYRQSYKNVEVILMDDCSTDDSRIILTDFQNRYPQKTKLIFNDVNSGGVFFQWEKGLSHASGELIWIAESDDWCSEDFLEKLVPFFKDEATKLAYCRSVFVDGKTEKQIWSIEEFLADIDSKMWQKPFVATAHQLVNHAWSIKNVVPNVSSAVFRNPKGLDLFEEASWKQMRICGDWMFYVHLVQGGLVAFTTEATNYYRIHESNTSISTHKKDIYYREHELVSREINRLYSVPGEVFHRQKESLKQHWINTRDNYSDAALSAVYNLESIESAAVDRKPNLLMVGYAFAAGGGETFPIQLANLFKASGFSVTFLCCDQEAREAGVRDMLRQDIPVVNNFLALNDLVKNFGIDVVHSHHAWVDNTILDILSPDNTCTHIVTTHGMYEMMVEDDLRKIIPRMMNRVRHFVYTAEKNLESFKKMGVYSQDRFTQIDNALEVTPVKRADLSGLGIAEDDFVVCLVSRAIPEKGWREAVDIVRKARDLSGRDIHLLLIGEGPEYDALKDIGLNYVHFLGFRSNIRDFYAASDLGFLPSRFPGESYPLTIIDCFHAGRPVLASDIGEISRMLQGEKGVAGALFPLEDFKIPIDEASRILARFVSDPLYYQRAIDSLEDAKEKFDPETLLRKYEQVYLDAVHR